MNREKLLYLISMCIFGTVGIFRRLVPYPSATVAFARSLIGVLFLLLIFRKLPDWKAFRKNRWALSVSGLLLGGGWILLFEAYNYTSVAVATVCYYMAPIFIILLSPFVLGEKITLKKGICSGIAMVGLVLVSGVVGDTGGTVGSWIGVVLSLLSALAYTAIVMLNKKIDGISSTDRTEFQLGLSALFLLPYIFLTDGFADFSWNIKPVLLLLTMGILHTGIAYALYFGNMAKVPTQVVAIFSYADPIIAVLLSALFLKEPMSVTAWIGTVLVLGSAVGSELKVKIKDGKK